MNENDFFLRYLNAKKTVDDRAINQHVWQTMADTVRASAPMRVLEIGTGLGTMVERMADQGLLNNVTLTAIDHDPNHVAIATERLQEKHPQLNVTFEAVDLFDFIEREQGQQWDMVMAHAFLDLVNIPETLPQIFSLLKPGGFFYFTINFDGGTTFEPTTDQWFDALVENVYHRTMDERKVNGRFSGDSKSGRHLFTHIPEAGGEIVAAGSSDWVVFPTKEGYPADEAFFLNCIIDFVEKSLTNRPEIDPDLLDDWVDEKRVFIQRNELVFVAHQLDFFGKYEL